ncbi:MAG: hypothetical protein WA659_04300 [Candidatus Aquirickettsiella sp.]
MKENELDTGTNGIYQKKEQNNEFDKSENEIIPIIANENDKSSWFNTLRKSLHKKKKINSDTQQQADDPGQKSTEPFPFDNDSTTIELLNSEGKNAVNKPAIGNLIDINETIPLSLTAKILTEDEEEVLESILKKCKDTHYFISSASLEEILKICLNDNLLVSDFNHIIRIFIYDEISMDYLNLHSRILKRLEQIINITSLNEKEKEPLKNLLFLIVKSFQDKLYSLFLQSESNLHDTNTHKIFGVSTEKLPLEQKVHSNQCEDKYSEGDEADYMSMDRNQHNYMSIEEVKECIQAQKHDIDNSPLYANIGFFREGTSSTSSMSSIQECQVIDYSKS